MLPDARHRVIVVNSHVTKMFRASHYCLAGSNPPIPSRPLLYTAVETCTLRTMLKLYIAVPAMFPRAVERGCPCTCMSCVAPNGERVLRIGRRKTHRATRRQNNRVNLACQNVHIARYELWQPAYPGKSGPPLDRHSTRNSNNVLEYWNTYVVVRMAILTIAARQGIVANFE